MKTDLNLEKTAVVFPGQGNRCLGLGRALIESFPEARKRLDRFSDVTDTDLYHLHTSDERTHEDHAIDTVKVHLAMVSYGLLSWELLTRVHRFNPSMVAGHSLGEITALACAGVIEPDDAMRLAKERGMFIADAGRKTQGGMKAFLGVPVEEIRSHTAAWGKKVREQVPGAEPVFEANINSSRQLVVSGRIEDLGVFEKKMADHGITALSLPVSGAFHSPYMNPAAARFYKVAEKIKFHPARLPVLSSMTGRMVTGVSGLSTQLALQMVKPVNWLKVMTALRKAGINLIVEAGPGNPVLCGLARSNTSWNVNTLSVPGLLENFRALGALEKINGNIS